MYSAKRLSANTAILAIVLAIVFLPSLSEHAQAAVVVGGLYEGVTTDAFDVSQGAIVTAQSSVLNYAGAWNPRSALGTIEPTAEPSHFIFDDNDGTPVVDFIDFALPAPITLFNIKLGLGQDYNFSTYRNSTSFALLASSDGNSYNTVSSASLAPDYFAAYGDHVITISDTMNVPNVQYFRLELTRGTSLGPRVMELDANVEGVVPAAVPEQSSVIVAALVIGSCLTARKWLVPRAKPLV